MRLYELFLTEAIHIEQKDVSRIQNAIVKWGDWLKAIDYVDANMSRQTYERYGEQLKKYINPIIRSVISPFFKSPEDLQNHRIDKDTPVNGYTFRFDIYGWGEGRGSSTQAFVQNWSTRYDKRNSSRSYNSLQILISPQDIVNIRAGRHETIDRITSYIVHETTHLIQGLKSSTHGPTGSHYSKDSEDREQSYLGLSYEIDSFAAETAACILLDGKRRDDVRGAIDTALQMIRYGMQNMFGRNLFQDNGAFARYSKAFRSFKKYISDEKVVDQNERIWRRYNKKLVDHLYKYRDATR